MNNEEFGVGLYEPYEEHEKDTDLKWYFCTLLYAKKNDKLNEGMIGMILYNKSNNPSFRKHVITAQKCVFKTLFLTWIGDQRLWLVMIHPPLIKLWIPLYRAGKYQMISPLALV